MAKLKNALIAQQHHAAHLAAKAKIAEAQKAKSKSIKKTLSGSSNSQSKSKSQRKSASTPTSQNPGPSRISNTKEQRNEIPKTKSTIPFDKSDTILLLGEANFSFALSLIREPHNHDPKMMVATSYDDEEVCYLKYPDARDNVLRLREGGVRVVWGVDAGDLQGMERGKKKGRKLGMGKGKGKSEADGDRKGKKRMIDSLGEAVGEDVDVDDEEMKVELQGEGQSQGVEDVGSKSWKAGFGRWSRVIFNFPHAGAGITDQDRNILSNQTLLLRTLRSVAPVLTKGPSAFPVHPSVAAKHGGGSGSGEAAGKKRKRSGSDDGDSDLELDFIGSDEQDGLEGVSDLEEDDLEDSGGPPSKIGRSKSRKKSQSGEDTMKPPNKEGTILFTLLDQPPYSLWDLKKLATRPPEHIPGIENRHLKCQKYRLLRSFEFHPEVYIGYAHRRTIGFKEGVSMSQNEEIRGRKGKARTWEFALWESSGGDDIEEGRVKGDQGYKGRREWLNGQ